MDLYNALGTSLINITSDGYDDTNGAHEYTRNHLVQVAKTSVVTNSDMMYIPGAKLKIADAPLPRQVVRQHKDHKQALKDFAKFPISSHKEWKDNWDKEAYSKMLTDETFDEAMRTHDFVMVNYHAPWCPWCTRLKPAWEHAAGIIQRTSMHDPDSDPETEKKFHGFESRGEAMYAWEEYNGKHEEEPMPLVDFLNDNRKKNGMEETDFADGQPKALLAKVDCTQQQRLCMRQNVMGFPTIRIHTDHKIQSFREYEGDRSAQDLIKYVHENLPALDGFTEEEEEEEAQLKKMKSTKESELSEAMEKRVIENGDSHGCNIVGTIQVAKVPGTLVLGAHSNDRSLRLENLNMSHIVHHLAIRSLHDPMLAQISEHDDYLEEFEERPENKGKRADDFGVYARRIMRNHKTVLEHGLDSYGMTELSNFLFPLNGKRYASESVRGKIAHYVKVVHTFILPKGKTSTMGVLEPVSVLGMLFSGWDDHMEIYQHQSHSSTDATVPPGSAVSLNITYDISPLAYELSTKSSNTAHFLTQLCAIIGGVFTVFGMVDSVIFNAASSLHSAMK